VAAPRRLALAWLSLVGLGSLAPTGAWAEPTLVVIVRHAERAAEPVDDPALSPAGERRAEALASALADARITSIITTHFRRTRDTAKPLAQRLGIAPQVITVRKGALDAHVPEVVAAIRRQSGHVLVVGHSDTVTEIVEALGGPVLPKLCDTSFGQVFVVSTAATPPSVVQLHYGETSPPAPSSCL
jgi:phosphohistidine phosphatase SixA